MDGLVSELLSGHWSSLLHQGPLVGVGVLPVVIWQVVRLIHLAVRLSLSLNPSTPSQSLTCCRPVNFSFGLLDGPRLLTHGCGDYVPVEAQSRVILFLLALLLHSQHMLYALKGSIVLTLDGNPVGKVWPLQHKFHHVAY